MTSDLSKFDKFEEIDDLWTIKLGHDDPFLVKGKGSLVLNEKIKCDHAFYVQRLKYNLSSVSHLNNSSHKLEFHKRRFKIFDDKANIIGIGMKIKDNVFYLDLLLRHDYFIELRIYGYNEKGCIM